MVQLNKVIILGVVEELEEAFLLYKGLPPSYATKSFILCPEIDIKFIQREVENYLENFSNWVPLVTSTLEDFSQNPPTGRIIVDTLDFPQ